MITAAAADDVNKDQAVDQGMTATAPFCSATQQLSFFLLHRGDDAFPIHAILSIYTLRFTFSNLSSTYMHRSAHSPSLCMSRGERLQNTQHNQREEATSFLKGLLLLLLAAAPCPMTPPPPRKAARRSLF